MDFEYSEDQVAIRDLAKQILEDCVPTDQILKLVQADGWYDRNTWKALADASLLGLGISEEDGGSGMGMEELVLVLEQAGRRAAPLPLLSTLVLGALPIAEFGTDEQKNQNLPEVAAGKRFLTAGLVEEGRRSAARCRTTATRVDGGYTLSGEKQCVPGASIASRILVPAQTDNGKVAVFLLDPATEGVTLLDQEVSSGEPHSQLVLADARVQDADILGSLDNGEEILDWIEARGMIAACSLQLGIADSALAQTVEYQTTRHQFGVPIGSFQGPQLRAADAWIDIEAMRSTLEQAVWRLATGREARREILVAKWWACRGGHRVAHTCQHLHGGIGADVEYPIHRWFLAAKQNEVFLGGASVHQARIGRMLVEGVAA
jgi:alkylation response protein AidB-like acyl-CoA dehydrogenase